MTGQGEYRQLKHQVSGNSSQYGSCRLRKDIRRRFRPGDSSFQSIGKGDRRIEVRAGNRSEGEDKSDQSGPRRYGVGKERNRSIAARKLFRHDARPNHRREEEGGADSFCTCSPSQGRG